MADRADSIQVIGLGNPILGDDGVGWRVVALAESRWAPAAGCRPVDFECLAVGGLALMEALQGCERAILVDAVTGDGAPGDLFSGPLDDLRRFPGRYANSVHDASLWDALEVGRSMDIALPNDIWVVAITIDPELVFSEELSAPVAAALPAAADHVLRQLEAWA